MNEETPTSKVLEQIVDAHEGDTISLFELSHALHTRGFGILILLFALPPCIPGMLPPIPTLFGVPLCFFCLQMAFAQPQPWLPKFLGKRQIKRTHLSFLVEKGARVLRPIEKVVRPRLRVFDSLTGERLLGLFGFLCALCIVLPIPLTNYIPSVGLVLISLGLLSKDGVFVVLGILAGIVGIVLTLLALKYGQQVFTWLYQLVF